MDIIGLTQCDESRKSRRREIDEVWQDLISSEGFQRNYIIFDSAINLFREALSCYQNGAYMATTIMCRSVVETTLYYSTTREPTKYFNGIVVEWKIITLEDDKFYTILEEVKKKYFIDKKLEDDIIDFRRWGNFVAHYGSQVDKPFEKITIKKTFAETYWIKRNHALEILKNTVMVIKHSLPLVNK